MLTLKKVNGEIERNYPGSGYSLVRGDGYFYVDGPGTECWNRTSIYVYRLNHMPMEKWLKEVGELIEENA